MYQRENGMEQTKKIVMAGLMTALVTVATMVLPIPIPGTTGYINLGDGIIFLSVFILGWKHGAFAGGVGAGLADLLLGSAVWAPWTLAVKAGMAIIVGLSAEHHPKALDRKILGAPVYGVLAMIAAVAWMACGYYIAEGVIYGNWVAPIIGLPWNLLQGIVGMVLACVLGLALEKTSAGKYFTYKL